jgi:hypothetical protein
MRTLVRNDDGSATAQVVIVMPLLMLVILVIVQFVVWLHAVHAVQAVAYRAMQTARVADGTDAAGVADARLLLSVIGKDTVFDPAVTATRDARQVRIRITGRAADVVPFVDPVVTAVAAGPIEQVGAAR